MDELDTELEALEAELKWLRPTVPSRRLWVRLERDLALRRRTGAWLWLALPAAAALAVTIGLRHSSLFAARPVQPPAPTDYAAEAPAFRPVAAEDLLVGAREAGRLTLEDGTPAREMAASYIDTITWEDSQNHASVRWSVPREEVRVVPVSYQ